MLSGYPSTDFRASSILRFFLHKDFCKLGSNEQKRIKLKPVAQSKGDKWNLHDIDTNAVQERLSSWLSKTQDFLMEVTVPLVKSNRSGKPGLQKVLDTRPMEELFMAEQTIESHTPNGSLSFAAIVSIEQFSRMNGLTGYKMQKIFKALVAEQVYNNTRNLVEYCCFRFLSRDSSVVHPCLKESAFQRLIFITMLAWEKPYLEENDTRTAVFQGELVSEDAFIRIAPAIPGVADHATAYNLFKVLAGDDGGISLDSWLAYVDELIKVHEGRKSYQSREHLKLPEERILCIGSSKKQPVLKWENNMAWPGKVILTDKALYFEAVGLLGRKDTLRFDLTRSDLDVQKAKVGPLGSVLFDSAVCISSGQRSETWVLEFVDLGGESRRDVWHAFITEVIGLHKFIRDFGPEDNDPSILQVYGAQRGSERATMSAFNSIARLQALQFLRKVLDDPIKLVHFSFLQKAPYGELVLQTLALNYWGGPLIRKSTEAEYEPTEGRMLSSNPVLEASNHVYDIDGSVYLRKWMRSPSWASSASVNFWKNPFIKQGLILSKNLVVADLTPVERAATACKEKSQAMEKTQATIDAAMLKGIPSNIDLFKELMLPLTLATKNFEKLRRWRKPHLTVSFLAFAYSVVFRDLLPYLFPVLLMVVAAGMLTLRGLKLQGRLGRSFGKVTIRDQPRSNTIQKIIAVKDAMRDVENYLQNLNVMLLKIRTIFLSGQPEITTEMALVLLTSGIILLVVPFKYIMAFLLFDLFTRELEFRKEMVKRFVTFLKDRWEQVPAAPVVVLPFETDESKAANQIEETD